MNTLVTIVVLILSLGIVTFVHELGHLIFAKKYNLFCPEFAVGMGPKLYSFKKGETEYSIRALPIGGFVRIAGEEDDGDEVEEGRRLFDATKLQQAMVLFAGAFFNFILGILLLIVANTITGVPINEPVIGQVVEGSIAYQNDFREGDIIVSVNGVEVTSRDDSLDAVVAAKEYGSLVLVLERDGKQVTHTFENIDKDFVLGYNYSTSRNLIEVLKVSFNQFIKFFVLIGTVLVGLFTDFSNTSGNVAGPVGVYNVLQDFMQYGVATTILFIATISINIGVFNLLPIPGLDGSKILIAISEHILKRDMPRKLYTIISVAGVLFLLGLMVLITIKDIINLT